MSGSPTADRRPGRGTDLGDAANHLHAATDLDDGRAQGTTGLPTGRGRRAGARSLGGAVVTAMDHYGSSPVKRARRTDTELALLDEAIVAAVEQEHPVSLRGVYYRTVSAGAVDKTENGYRAVGRRLLVLRRTGRVPYSRITDGTRWVRRPQTHRDVDDALDDLAASYRRMLWREQPVEVHVFVEKDAISGVVLPVTARYDVPLGVLRGYCSETFAEEMGRALSAARKPVIVAQLGDHDPSGVGAWEDFARKVAMFAPDAEVEFRRLAVTPAQIDELRLPTRPTKGSDTRSRGWVGGSVEVDAIPATTLRQLVEDAILEHLDRHQLAVTRAVERSEREGLRALAAGGLR